MNTKDVLDIGGVVAICGLVLTLGVQIVHIYERITRIEAAVQSESVLCDCFETRSRLSSLEYRVKELEEDYGSTR